MISYADMANKGYFEDENHFKSFSKTLAIRLNRYETLPPKELLHKQRAQLQELISLEKQFRDELKKTKEAPKILEAFYVYIMEDKGKLMSARPFFRERSTEFVDKISPVLKNKTLHKLLDHDINYFFIKFSVDSGFLKKRFPGLKLYTKIKQLRQEITEQNIPLAISQAKLFWKKTPKSHLSYMDLVQIHVDGLCSAVDKFVPPKKKMSEEESLAAYKMFRGMAIGRMVGDRIREYSSTLVRFYSNDKRKIYNANKIARFHREGEYTDFDAISQKVNENLQETGATFRTTPTEIANLMSGASHLSGETKIGEDSDETVLTQYDDTLRDEEPMFIETDALKTMRKAIWDYCSIREQKILIMLGMAR